MINKNLEHTGHHFVAIFGGSVSGSEAAFQLANRGFRVVVFEQNILPYGKIEDGLPKWHAKLRDKEEKLIDDKLDHINIRYVPCVRLGRDLDFHDLVNNWGFSAVLLATGAWKDRPVPIEGIDDYVEKGLVYQNPFVYWFNHYHEPTYKGRQYEVPDNAVVVGGGLASLDVVKIVMIETVQKALQKRGIDVDMFKLERSIAKTLEEHNLTMDELGLKGCTLYYRREAKDMPLSSLPKNTPEGRLKAEAVNRKILENFLQKYLFRFEPLSVPVDKVVENGRLAGITFQRTKVENGKVVSVSGEFHTHKTSMVISSIGSIPEKIEGIPADGTLFKMTDEKSCRLIGFENVFALGNAVTGRGNIKESQEHGRDISVDVMENHFQWQEDDYQQWLRGTEEGITEQVSAIAEQIKRQKFMPEPVIKMILDRTEKLMNKVGFEGEYREWIKRHTPVRLEELIGERKP